MTAAFYISLKNVQETNYQKLTALKWVKSSLFFLYKTYNDTIIIKNAREQTG